MTTVVSYERRSRSPRAVVASETSDDELDLVVGAASDARPALAALERGDRARMLEDMAERLEARREELVQVADAETALGPERLHAELTRTVGQFRLFATVVRDGQFLDVVIDHAQDAVPDLRRINRPIGVVGVFGASNFPFAFSVPGGDTASAFAAGCPVVAKAHPAHPDTCIRSADVLRAAILDVGLPSALLGLVHGVRAGAALVAHPEIAAVGFTGSQAGGIALQRIAAERPSPIPFFGELGSVNPLIVLPHAARARGREIAQGLARSVTMSAGQFCTKPGLALVPNEEMGCFFDDLQEALAGFQPQPLLHDGISDAFHARLDALRAVGVQVPDTGHPSSPRAVALRVDLDSARGDDWRLLFAECFGPFTVVVPYRDPAHLRDLLGRVPPSLAVSIHADEPDGEAAAALLDEVLDSTGRVVWNGYPTGVAVTWSMHHGGPHPATTNAQHTSVGAASIRRWLRPVVLQDVPAGFLPAELVDDRPGLAPRRVDGTVRP